MSKGHILILEDHQGLANMINDLFTTNGYEVTIAGNGQHGLEYAQKGGFAAIICDLKMPVMDGMSFLKALQENPPAAQNGPIIVYSNFAYQYSKDEALRRGAADFIAKDTLGTVELVAHVENLIKAVQNQAISS
jgi:two-component system, NtrC family, response regulator AtoC